VVALFDGQDVFKEVDPQVSQEHPLNNLNGLSHRILHVSAKGMPSKRLVSIVSEGRRRTSHGSRSPMLLMSAAGDRMPASSYAGRPR